MGRLLHRAVTAAESVTNAKAGDALSLVAAESRRRGMSSEGRVNAAVYHAAAALLRYGQDGKRLARGIPDRKDQVTFAEALRSLPDSTWIEAGAEHGRAFELEGLLVDAERSLDDARMHHRLDDTHRASQYALAAHDTATEVAIDPASTPGRISRARTVLAASNRLMEDLAQPSTGRLLTETRQPSSRKAARGPATQPTNAQLSPHPGRETPQQAPEIGP